jgi:hypothetical protein
MAVTASTLWSYARKQYGDRVGTKADQEIQDAVNDAVWMVALARKWPYLHTSGRINLKAYYNTGTLAVTNARATVTLTGGVFPANAASADLLIGSTWQSILTRDSNTQVTLDNAWGEASATGVSYTIAQYSYTLPSDLISIEHILPGSAWPWGPEPVSAALLEVSRMRTPTGQNVPCVFGIRKDQILFWPFPTEDKMVNITYFRRPAAMTSSANEMDFDEMHLELIRRAIDYQIATRGDCVAGNRRDCWTWYQESLASAASFDKTAENRNLVNFDNGDGGTGSQLFNTVSG